MLAIKTQNQRHSQKITTMFIIIYGPKNIQRNKKHYLSKYNWSQWVNITASICCYLNKIAVNKISLMRGINHEKKSSSFQKP